MLPGDVMAGCQISERKDMGLTLGHVTHHQVVTIWCDPFADRKTS